MTTLDIWLDGVGLGKYKKKFQELEVDLEILPDLTEDDLEKVGIPLGARKKILKGAASLSRSDTDQSAVVSTFDEAGLERRQLTVMFCDLVGSTALSGEFDPEDLRHIISAFQEACIKVIDNYAGNTAQFAGDGIFVYFGYPVAHEDDAERAIRTGIDVIDAVSQVSIFDLDLKVRVGIATGLVVIGDMAGEGGEQEHSIVGETPNLAERLTSLAEPNTLVIGNKSWQLAGGIFDYIDRGLNKIKGFTEPVQVWQVVAEKTIESRFEATRTGGGIIDLIGREEELEVLKKRWRLACAGKGQVATLTGEAGIGKSRLVQELRDYVVSQDHTLIRFYCTTFHQNSSLNPIISQLERTAEFMRGDDDNRKLDKLEKLLGNEDNDLSEIVPYFAALLSIDTGSRYPQLALTPAILREKIMISLLAYMMSSSRRAPLLVIFEDLHWVDPSSLEFLDRAINQIENGRILVVATSRPEFTGPWTTLPHNITITLNRLDHDRIRQLILKVTGGKALPDLVINTIVSNSDGTPLFIEELTKTVLDAGLLSDTGDTYVLDGPLPAIAVPSTLQDSLLARLNQTVSVKETAQTGAVIGRVFDYELLSSLSSLAEDGLIRALNELEAAELVYRRGYPPESRYTFKHALVQVASYDSLLRSKRQQLHKQIAGYLEKHYPELVDNQPELLAYHFTGAGIDGYSQAVNYWQKAGKRAIARSAYLESVAHCRQGLELIEEFPELPEKEQLELQLRLLMGVGLVATKGYAAEEIAENYGRAREVCNQLDDTPRLIPTLYGLWLYHFLRGHRKETFDLANQLYKFSSNREHALVTSSALAQTLFWTGDREVAATHLAETMSRYDPVKHDEIAQTFGDEADLLSYYYGYWNLWLGGYPDQAETLLQQANELVEQLGTPYATTTAMLFEWILMLELRNVEAVAESATRQMRHSSEHGFPFFVAAATIGLGWVEVQSGNAERGMDMMQEGLATYKATGTRLAIPYYLHLMIQGHLACGNWEAGLEAVDEALHSAETLLDDNYAPELHRLKGELLLHHLNDDTESEKCFRRALELARAENYKIFELRAAVSLSRLLRDRNEHDSAYSQLSSALDGFTEGFDSVDLVEAQSLLKELT